MAVDANGKEMVEYPKMLYFDNGERHVVNNKAEEKDCIAACGELKAKPELKTSKKSGNTW